nr:MAG TPA: hypothetical protein [Caudoviricetes sp.]
MSKSNFAIIKISSQKLFLKEAPDYDRIFHRRKLLR